MTKRRIGAVQLGAVPLLVGLAFAPRVALANIEIPTYFDARHAGMGSTGTAFADNPAAAYYNPAAIDGMQRFSATAAIAPFAPAMKVPFNGAEITSERQVEPLFFAGGAYRLPVLQDRLVMGLALYPTAGMGATYKNVASLGGEELRASIFSMEAALPISVRLMDGLALAVAPRFTYASQTVHSPQVQQGTMVMADQEISGSSMAGVSVGVFFQPMKPLRLGLNYRSKVTVDVSGSTKMAGMSLDTSSQFVSPHSFRLGAAYSLMEEQVLIALDLRYSLYAEAYKDSTITLGPTAVTSPMNWKNSLTACVGAEYIISKLVPVRLGYTWTNSATPNETASAFTPPPGPMHSVHVGAGLKLPRWNIDAAFYHTFAGSSDVAASQTNMGAGSYELNSYLAVLSVNHHF